jgi:hypothetical protein
LDWPRHNGYGISGFYVLYLTTFCFSIFIIDIYPGKDNLEPTMRYSFHVRAWISLLTCTYSVPWSWNVFWSKFESQLYNMITKANLASAKRENRLLFCLHNQNWPPFPLGLHITEYWYGSPWVKVNNLFVFIFPEPPQTLCY